MNEPRQCNICGIYQRLTHKLSNKLICNDCEEKNYITPHNLARRLHMSIESLKAYRINKKYDVLPQHDARIGITYIWSEATIQRFIDESPDLDNTVINNLSEGGMKRCDIAKLLDVTDSQLRRHCLVNNLISFTSKDPKQMHPSASQTEEWKIRDKYNKISDLLNKSLNIRMTP